MFHHILSSQKDPDHDREGEEEEEDLPDVPKVGGYIEKEWNL